MAIVILGGLGTLVGPVVGAFVYLGLEDILKIWSEHWMIVMGPILVLIALVGEHGLLGKFFGARQDG